MKIGSEKQLYIFLFCFSLSCSKPAALVVGFELPSYTIIEGETRQVCVEIKEPKTAEVDLLAPVSIVSMDGTASETQHSHKAQLNNTV